MRVIAKDPGKPVVLRAALNYAVCEKICIPVEANAELAFNSVASTEDAALTAALDTVPKPATLGDTAPLTVRDVKRDGKNVLVDVVAPEGSTPSLFVEGPTPEWALPIPKPLKQSPAGVNRFSFELDGLPPGATADGAALKLTLVGTDRSYEFNVTLP
jgi:DsbC/DsbD-like thiol-disulfide interchange protein